MLGGLEGGFDDGGFDDGGFDDGGFDGGGFEDGGFVEVVFDGGLEPEEGLPVLGGFSDGRVDGFGLAVLACVYGLLEVKGFDVNAGVPLTEGFGVVDGFLAGFDVMDSGVVLGVVVECAAKLSVVFFTLCTD